MVNSDIVENGNGKKIHINDILKGLPISKDYKCLICKKGMSYVKESEYKYTDKDGNKHVTNRKAHFRHINDTDGSDCEKKKYKDYTKKDIENEYNNVKSDFHKNWQDMFDVNNLEHRIVENDKTHYADIYLECNEGINILTNNSNVEEVKGDNIFINNPEKLVIEVQHSSISENKIIERSNFYHNDEMKREIMWIFDLHDKCNIIKIITFYETKYRLKLLDHNKHDFQNLFKIKNFKPILMLDNCGKKLYFVRELPRLDQDYLDVIPILREDFLNQLSKYVNKELKWEGTIREGTIKKLDYESSVLKIKNIDENKKNVIRYIFYILEYIKMDKLMNVYNLMESLYIFLMNYSNNNIKIKELFSEYLFTHRIHYNSNIDGKGLAQIEFERLYDIYKRIKDVYVLINFENYDLICALEKMYDKKKDREKINDIKKNNSLYKDVFEYVRQRIEYYEYYKKMNIVNIMSDDKLFFYKYLKSKIDIMEYNIENDTNIKYSINEEDNIYINMDIEKIKLIKNVCINTRICNFCYEDTKGVCICNKLIGVCNNCYNKSINELNEMLKESKKYERMREERIKKEKEEKIRIEEEKRKNEEEKKKIEEEKKRMEEKKKKEDERIKIEEERRKMEERLMYEEEKYERDRLYKIKRIEEEKKMEKEKYERERLDKIKRAEEEKIIEKRRKENYNEKVEQNNMYKEDNRHIILKNNKEIEDKVNEKERVDKKYENHINMIKDEMKNKILKNDYKVIIKYKFLYETTIIECVKRANSFDNMVNILYDINNKLGDDNVRKVDVYCNGLLIYDFNNMDECYKVINNMFVLKDVA